jgi:hypothetical protein
LKLLYEILHYLYQLKPFAFLSAFFNKFVCKFFSIKYHIDRRTILQEELNAIVFDLVVFAIEYLKYLANSQLDGLAIPCNYVAMRRTKLNDPLQLLTRGFLLVLSIENNAVIILAQRPFTEIHTFPTRNLADVMILLWRSKKFNNSMSCRLLL